MTEKKWADMTGKERAAYARSFRGKKKPTELQVAKTKVAEAVMKAGASATVELGAAFANMTQEQRDAILRHPAIQTAKARKW